MEFEDMKKIWDTQNDKPLFAIDEKALLRRVLAKRKGSQKLSGINEAGLILINLSVIVTFTVKALGPDGSIHHAVTVASLLGVTAYILYLRHKRKKEERHYGRALLDELDHAIASRHYLERMAKTMIWWYTLPLALPIIIPLIFNEPTQGHLSKLLLIAGACALSYLLTRWEARRVHGAKKRELQNLREMLVSSH